MEDMLNNVSPMTFMLVSAIVWLSGLFVWLIKKFVDSFEKNTATMTRVGQSLDGVERKLETSVERDIEIVKMLEKIHARQDGVPSVNVHLPENVKNGSN